MRYVRKMKGSNAVDFTDMVSDYEMEFSASE
jgi:hypothetical protein